MEKVGSVHYLDIKKKHSKLTKDDFCFKYYMEENNNSKKICFTKVQTGKNADTTILKFYFLKRTTYPLIFGFSKLI